MPVRFSYPRSFALALCSLSLVPSAVSADSLPWTKRKKPAVYSPSDYKAPADAYANGAYSPVDAPADYSGNSSSDPYADPAANAPADNVIVRRLPKSTLPSAGNSSYAAATPDYSGAGAVYDDPADNDGSAGANYGDSNRGTYRMSEISAAGRNFFGGVSENLASVIEHAFRQSGEPNGYILGEEAGGAFIAGLRYGEGTLYTKNAGDLRVYWQGPSVGFDWGGDGARTMTLV